MARLTPHKCESPECDNIVIPKPNARRSKYCSDKCKQFCYRLSLKQQKLAKARTITLEQSIGYQYLEEIVPEMNQNIEHFGVVFGHDLCVSAIALIGEIGLMIKNKVEQCQPQTT